MWCKKRDTDFLLWILFVQEKNSEERFHIEVHFSPGAYGVNVPTSTQPQDRNTSNGRGYRPNKGRSHVNPVKVPASDNVDSDVGHIHNTDNCLKDLRIFYSKIVWRHFQSYFEC